ncbi:hypothetical protein [Natronosalvus rutilus]|nr:hypothetical protein [Natronosalvus rutilus]
MSMSIHTYTESDGRSGANPLSKETPATDTTNELDNAHGGT